MINWPHFFKMIIVFLIWLAMIMLILLFVGGCQTNKYVHNLYYPDGQLQESWVVDITKAMTSTEIADVNMVLSDGSRIRIIKSITYYDPNTWVYIGEGIRRSGLPVLLIP